MYLKLLGGNIELGLCLVVHRILHSFKKSDSGFCLICLNTFEGLIKILF